MADSAMLAVQKQTQETEEGIVVVSPLNPGIRGVL